MMRRVGEVLSFQTKTGSLLIYGPTFSFECAIEEVSGIDLNTRLIGLHAQDAAAGLFVNFSGLGQIVSASIDHPVLVIAAGNAKWFVIGVNTLSNAPGFAEIQRSLFHRLEFAGGNQIGIGPGEPRCI